MVRKKRIKITNSLATVVGSATTLFKLLVVAVTVIFYTSIILTVCGTPWEPTSTHLLGGPRVWRPEKVNKNIEGYPIFALAARNPDKPPACQPIGIPPWPPPPPQRLPGCRLCVHGPRGSGFVDRCIRSLGSGWIPSDHLSASTTSPEPLPPR